MGTRRAVTALRVTSIALVIAGIVGAFTVGGTAKKAGAQQVATIRSAASNFTAAGTVTVRFKMHVTVNGHDLDFDGEQHQDFANQRAVSQFHFPAPLGDMDIVLIGNTTYLRTNSTTGTDGQPGWWRIDIADGLLASDNQSSWAGAPDAAQYLEYLTSISDDVTDEGNTTIDGVAVHHYSARLDLAKILNKQGIDSQRAALQQLEQQGIHIDASAAAFIDDGGLPLRVTIKMSAKNVVFDARIDFVDYGAPVEVIAPPDEQVVHTAIASTPEELFALGQTIGRLSAGG